MKRLFLLFIILLFPLILFGQNSSILKDAQDLFAAGNYSAAVGKFQEVVNKLSGKERNIASLQLNVAKACVEALSKARTAESVKDHDAAIAEYQKVLDANPADGRVKSLQAAARKAKQEANPSLTVSTSSLSFSSSGGTQRITVNCNMTWTLLDETSSMCLVSRSGNEITINCSSNSTYSSRSTYFTVRTTNGIKEQRISISQSGGTYTPPPSSSYSSSGRTSSVYLNITQTSIWAEKTSGSVYIDVSTNADDYYIELLPSWCKIESKYTYGFRLSYTANPDHYTRSDWFKVTAGGKSVKITITQAANYSSYSGTSSSSSYGRTYYKPQKQLYNASQFLIGATAKSGFTDISFGGYLGFYAENFNMEIHSLYGTLSKTYQYDPLMVGIKIGGGFVMGSRTRLTFQGGSYYMTLMGKNYGSSYYFRPDTCFAVNVTGGIKLSVALASVFELNITPEYAYPVYKSDSYKLYYDSSPLVKKWTEGFRLNLGLGFFF